MSDPADRDLSAAFEELTAPTSTANYSTRSPAARVPTSSTRWPQVLAGSLAVVVALAGAGTFLALRSARQGGTASGVAGTPPARAGAAMAYDSTSGVTVMFGGVGADGRQLADAWTWDGSSWRSAAEGPGPLDGARLVDDPADGGVLLVGTPVPPGEGGGVASGGCSGGATGVPGITATPIASPGVAPAASAPAVQPKPPVGPVPTDAVPAPGSTVRAFPASLCPAPAAPPGVQTWVFNSSGWHRAAARADATTPPGGADLAFDPTTRQVVAAAPPGLTCGPPLETPIRSGGALACPALGSASSTVAIAPAPCAANGGCPGPNGLSSWTWSGGSWRKVAADSSVQPRGLTLLFNDPATQHVVLMAQSGIGSFGGIAYPAIACQPIQQNCASTVPMVTTWMWSGSGWVRVSQVRAPEQAPDFFGGAAVAAVSGRVVVLTAAGDTWTFASGQWTLNSPSRHPQPRTGAGIAEGPNGTVVLFGGFSSPGPATSSSAGSLGSDTWTWSGSTWRQLGGTAPVAPPSPSSVPCASASNTAAPPCVSPLPAPVPGAPGVVPASTTTPSPLP